MTSVAIDPGAIVGTSIDSIQTAVESVAPKALLVGAAVFGLGLVWRIGKRFVKG